ncbi:MAG: ERF family protein [Treponema sp.]|nr:ERF family protein [Treponema sp.]
MTQSENINELLAALAEVQNELPTMPKSAQAYGYNYTDLDTITQTIKPILHEHGVAYMQSVGGTNEDCMTLTTRLFHKTGQFIEDTAALPKITNTKNNAAQTLGMSITYMRRYMLCAMLGITSDEDTDANAEQKPQGAAKSTPPKNNPPPQKPSLGFEPKGGETTPEEKKEISNLLTSKTADGKSVFTKGEMKAYSDKRKDYTAREVIDQIKTELQKRLAHANPADLAEQAAAEEPPADMY